MASSASTHNSNINLWFANCDFRNRFFAPFRITCERGIGLIARVDTERSFDDERAEYSGEFARTPA